MKSNRRQFLRTTSVGGAAMSGLLPGFVARADKAPKANTIRYDADLEPIVRLIEDTPREKCMEAVAEQVRGGLSYDRLLSAVFFAALRKVKPHHSVYKIYSTHRISQSLPEKLKLLPLFWAIDGFKWHQLQTGTTKWENLKGTLPPADKAAGILKTALQNSDRENAERAAVVLARNNEARKVYDLLWHYGCASGGHRPIRLANCWRAMEAIGWQHAEPVLRFAVLGVVGRGNSTYEPNMERAERTLKQLPKGWEKGKTDRSATLEAYAVMRQGKTEDAIDLALKQLPITGAQPLWDAMHLITAEVFTTWHIPRQLSWQSLHSVTSLSAHRFAFNTCQTPASRLLILLQACVWAAGSARARWGEEDRVRQPLKLSGAKKLPASASDGIEEVFDMLPGKVWDYDPVARKGPGFVFDEFGDRWEAAKRLYAVVEKHPQAVPQFMQSARIWMATKATLETHEYKLPAALFEDVHQISPEWRPHVLAASAKWLHGSQSKDNPAVAEAQEALR